MIKRLEVNLVEGNLENGFNRIDIKLRDASGLSILSLKSSLASAIKVNTCYDEWRLLHEKFYQQPTPDPAKNIQIEVTASDVNSQHQKLKDVINDWLHTRDFCATEKQIRTALDEEDEIMMIISTKDDLAWRLPWHLWSFFDDYRNAGVVLSYLEFRKVNSKNNSFCEQKVLVIVDTKNRDNELKYWGERKKIDLDTLLGEELSDEEVLPKVSEKLYQQNYNILFFAGHSSSDTNNGNSKIWMKDQPISIDQLNDALNRAISQGLQLVILNSCDGLGLAQNLLKLNLPKVIFMREVVEDRVAEAFLKNFLEEFIEKKGTPAFLAVRRARERLQGLENRFPSARLLPVMCSNPATEPLVIPPDSDLKPKPKQHSLLCLLLKWIFPGLVSDEEQY